MQQVQEIRSGSDADALKRKAKLSDEGKYTRSAGAAGLGPPLHHEERSGRQAIPPVRRAEQETLLNQRTQDSSAVLGRQREQAGRLFDRWREAAHLGEFAAHAIDNVGRRSSRVERAD